MLAIISKTIKVVAACFALVLFFVGWLSVDVPVEDETSSSSELVILADRDACYSCKVYDLQPVTVGGTHPDQVKKDLLIAKQIFNMFQVAGPRPGDGCISYTSDMAELAQLLHPKLGVRGLSKVECEALGAPRVPLRNGKVAVPFLARGNEIGWRMWWEHASDGDPGYWYAFRVDPE